MSFGVLKILSEEKYWEADGLGNAELEDEMRAAALVASRTVEENTAKIAELKSGLSGGDDVPGGAVEPPSSADAQPLRAGLECYFVGLRAQDGAATIRK